jgi:SM-20-related protein
VVVQDGFLSPAGVRGLIQCADARQAQGAFNSGRVGAGNQRRTRAEIRGDSTCWLSEPLHDAERALLRDLEELRLGLNREGYLGLFDLELHFAHYPVGTGYARHVDQLQGSGERRVSLVLYLNENWPADAGGELRVFDPDGSHRDIEPLAGRLVYFLTANREHAVLPAQRDRWSVSGWFRSRSTMMNAAVAP